MSHASASTNTESVNLIHNQGELEELQHQFHKADQRKQLKLLNTLVHSIVRLSRKLDFPRHSIIEYLYKQGFTYSACEEFLPCPDETVHKTYEETIENLLDHSPYYDLYNHINRLLRRGHSLSERNETQKLKRLIDQLDSDELFEQRKMDRGKEWLKYEMNKFLKETEATFNRTYVFQNGNRDEPEFLLELKETLSNLISEYLSGLVSQTKKKYQDAQGRWDHGREGIQSWVQDLLQPNETYGTDKFRFLRLNRAIGKSLPPKSVGQLVRSLRSKAVVSQQKCVDETGICSRQNLSNIETGEVTHPSYSLIRNLGQYLGKTIQSSHRPPDTDEKETFLECCNKLPSQQQLEHLMQEDHIPHQTMLHLVKISSWLLQLPELFLTDTLLLNEAFHKSSPHEERQYKIELLAFLNGLHTRYRNYLLGDSWDYQGMAMNKADFLNKMDQAGYLFGRMLHIEENYPPTPSSLQQMSTFDSIESINPLLDLLVDYNLIERKDTNNSYDVKSCIQIRSSLNHIVSMYAGLTSPFIEW